MILVYDLGGGTFDASLVELRDGTHTVIGSAGISILGGDDFDEILAALVMEAAGLTDEPLSAGERFALHEECRRAKEALHRNTRRVALDLSLVYAIGGGSALPLVSRQLRAHYGRLVRRSGLTTPPPPTTPRAPPT